MVKPTYFENNKLYLSVPLHKILRSFNSQSYTVKDTCKLTLKNVAAV